MEKLRILREFMVLNCITDTAALERYVDFCIEKSHPAKIPKETATHHILPRAKTLPFGIFKSLSENPWNSAELSYYHHYIAHYLLTLAIDHIAVLHSFVAMHNKDVKINRISECDLIEEEEFARIYKARNEMWSQRMNEIIEVNGVLMTRGKFDASKTVLSEELLQQMSDRMAGEKNIVHMDGVLDKIRSTKANTFIDGKNLDTISAERAATTMNKQFCDAVTGEVTTIYEQNGRKHSETLLKTFTDDHGNLTTLSTIYSKRRSALQISKGKFYKLRNVFDQNTVQILSAIAVRNLSPGLEKCTVDTYLGKTKFGYNILTKRGKANLIGLYVERLR